MNQISSLILNSIQNPILNLNIKPNIEPNINQPNIEPIIQPDIERNIEPNIEPNIETQYWNPCSLFTAKLSKQHLGYTVWTTIYIVFIGQQTIWQK